MQSGGPMRWRLAPADSGIPGSQREWASRGQEPRRAFSRAVSAGREKIEITNRKTTSSVHMKETRLFRNPELLTPCPLTRAVMGRPGLHMLCPQSCPRRRDGRGCCLLGQLQACCTPPGGRRPVSRSSGLVVVPEPPPFLPQTQVNSRPFPSSPVT